MTWKEVEHIFNRALSLTFSRRKLLFTIPVLIFCGLVIVFCRTLAVKAGNWMTVSLAFLPIFFCSAIFLALGIILTRVYHHQVKQMPVSYRRTLMLSKDLVIEVAYLTVPVILAYLVLWTTLGIFYLLKALPFIGNALSVILSFGPFLLFLGSLVLCLASISTLFFVTPSIALKSSFRFDVLEAVLERFKFSPFSNLALMMLGLLPILFIVGLMSLAAVVTGKSYIMAEKPLALSAQWFFIMVPFSTLLAPAVIFFFNFAAECHVLLQKKAKAA